MVSITHLQSIVGNLSDVREIVELVNDICKVNAVSLYLVTEDSVLTTISSGKFNAFEDDESSFLLEVFKHDKYLSLQNILRQGKAPKLQTKATCKVKFIGVTPICSIKFGKLGMLCILDDRHIRLTRLQKHIVQMLSRMISIMIDWELSQKELANYVTEIESKNESLRQIALVQSHDIRQPLTSIMGLINLVMNDVVPADQNWLNMMNNATSNLDDKIKTIVNQTMAEKDLKILRFNKMVEEIEDYAILLIDHNGNIENWNRGAQIIKGYRATEIIGKHFSCFYTDEDREAKLPQTLLNEAENKGKVTNEGWRVRKDGTLFWARVLITSIHNENNEVIGFTKMTRDLTEIKYSQESLKLSEQINKQVIDSLNDYAIISLDNDGYILNWNLGAQKIKGYTPDEVIGQHFSLFYTTDDKKEGLPQLLLQEATENGRAYHEGWRLKKDGSRFWGSITITSLFDTSGEHVGFTKVTKDLTSKKYQKPAQYRN